MNTVLVGMEAIVQVGISPTTVTVAVQVELLPDTSVTVKVTVLLPRLVQLNVDLDTL